MREIITSTLVGLLAGTAGAMGLGGGTVLLIYLTMFAGVQQLTAQGINLIFFIPTAAVATVLSARRGLLDKRVIMRYALFGCMGVLSGNMLSSHISTDLLSKLLGGLLLVIGLRELFGGAKQAAKVNR